MTTQPETFKEVLERMDAVRIKRFILEAEAYLEEQTSASILTVLKVGAGLGLDCSVVPQREEKELVIMAQTPEGMAAGWRALGKFVTNAGNLMSKVGVNTHILLENVPGQEGSGACAATLKTFPPKYKFLLDAEEGDIITAIDVLKFLEPDYEDNK